jgi:hypothetical protein
MGHAERTEYLLARTPAFGSKAERRRPPRSRRQGRAPDGNEPPGVGALRVTVGGARAWFRIDPLCESPSSCQI